MASTPDGHQARIDQLLAESRVRSLTSEERHELAGHYRAVDEPELARRALGDAGQSTPGGESLDPLALSPPEAEGAEPPSIEPVPPPRPALPVGALLVLAGTGVIAGLVVGLSYWLVAQVFELFILYPVVAGVVVAAVLGKIARQRRIRNVVLVGLIGFLAGTLCYATKLELDCAKLLREAAGEVATDPEQPHRAQVAAFLRRQAARPWGALRYGLPLQAEVGVSIGHAGVAEHRFAIRGAGFYFLVLLEWLICALPTAQMGTADVRQRLCPVCGDWCGATTLWYAAEADVEALRAAVETMDWPAASAIGERVEDANQAPARVNLEACPDRHQVYLAMRRKSGAYLRTWEVNATAQRQIEQAAGLTLDEPVVTAALG